MQGFSWSSAKAYEHYVGRWSRPVAALFIEWLGLAPELDWLEVGCGTGALSTVILNTARPRTLRAYDLSPQHVTAARRQVRDPRAEFVEADARRLPEQDGVFDAAVSGLLLNFVPEPEQAMNEMRRVLRPGGTAAGYVWDYAEGMQLIRIFWDAAIDLDPAAAELDEGRRFPLCRPVPLRTLFESAGLRRVEVRAIDVPTPFQSFDDYWLPFLGGQGPAPGYVASLGGEERNGLRALLEARLPRAADGTIPLLARAWAARGEV